MKDTTQKTIVTGVSVLLITAGLFLILWVTKQKDTRLLTVLL